MGIFAEIDVGISHVDEMVQDGVTVYRDLIAAEALPVLREEIGKIRDVVMVKIASMERPLRDYSDIAERHLGRLDYRCGFSADIFKQVETPIVEIVRSLSPTVDFRRYWGAIPSLGGSGPTSMHRDVYPMLNSSEGVNLDRVDLGLPPYYFTALIPLVEITSENGPTQFIRGSHRVGVVDESHAEIYAPLLVPGDVVIFEGRTLHRGSANRSESERLIAYITFVAIWYHDQTFAINDYLFPEFLL